MDACGVAVNRWRGVGGKKALFQETDGDSSRYPDL
jgi:hypothetical protein